MGWVFPLLSFASLPTPLLAISYSSLRSRCHSSTRSSAIWQETYHSPTLLQQSFISSVLKNITMDHQEGFEQGTMARKRKHTDDQQDDSKMNLLSAENKHLQAEIKLLKDWLADLRDSIASRDKLVGALEKMLDTANKENERLRESQAKPKTPEDTRSLTERLQNQHFDAAHARFYPNASTKPK
ncbi:uncharacterized protein FMAN_11115 [Fusarium mangiferae]|uniref:Uncharacterized protein n=1 Tax=Fusarium mangiferae TaxID=192010 RepID=A0A1L7TPS5_FUSMA|nr:uncharacterized protein FMAN_11115 [Fusarium mangiferae]CVK96786.1 uncharacterized protein FMAN_11115 [Fusarium mangiferae]